VVIAIIGILSGLIVVSMSGVTQKANIAKAQVFSNSLRNSLMLNLISEWKFDGDLTDSWVNNDGAWSGTTAPNTIATYKTSSECISGQCFSFDGVDDCVTVTDNVSLNVTTTFSIEMWIKRSAVSTDIVSLLRRDSSDAYALYSSAGSTGILVRFKDSTATHRIGNASAVSTGQWNHIVGLYDGRYLKFYTNGISGTPNDIGAFTVAAGSGDLIIGRNDASVNRYFNGLMDDIRIYNTALSSSQIKQNYIAGLDSMLSNGTISKEEYNERINNLAYDK